MSNVTIFPAFGMARVVAGGMAVGVSKPRRR